MLSCQELAALWLYFHQNRTKVTAARRFISQTWYSLGESAQAFLIIMATDMFVGYHSAEGWEALLLSVGRHFGIEENHVLILGFIATFLVILDALFKFWIFQYLRQASPSTSTIYKEMDS
ncbi:MAG: hypothetical protein AAGE92_03260 [Cyanobacteria bacterium P01_G01_bin.4]